jgi:hypothetical protein
VVEGHHQVFLRIGPRQIDALVIRGRRRRGEAVVVVLAVLDGAERALPEQTSVFAVEAERRPQACLLVARGHEDALAANDGGTVSGPRQRCLPADMGRGPLCRHSGRGADAAAIGSPKAQPVLCRAWRRQQRQEGTRRGSANGGVHHSQRLRVSFQTSLSMLLPATSHSAPSCANTLAAWRGRHGVFGTSCQWTPSSECQTSLRFALL